MVGASRRPDRGPPHLAVPHQPTTFSTHRPRRCPYPRGPCPLWPHSCQLCHQGSPSAPYRHLQAQWLLWPPDGLSPRHGSSLVPEFPLPENGTSSLLTGGFSSDRLSQTGFSWMLFLTPPGPKFKAPSGGSIRGPAVSFRPNIGSPTKTFTMSLTLNVSLIHI